MRSACGRGRAVAYGPIAAVLGAILFSITPSPASGQQEPAAAPDTVAAAAAGWPDPLEVTGRLRTLMDSAAIAERQIAMHAELQALRGELEAVRPLHAELQQLLLGLGEAEFVRADRIARVRLAAMQEEQRLAALDEAISARLTDLGQLRTEWTQRRQFWTGWQARIQAEGDFALFEPELARAHERIRLVLERIAAALPEILALQREVQAFRSETAQIIDEASSMLVGRREALLERDQPALFTPAFLERLRDSPTAEWQPREALRADGYFTFLRGNVWLLLLHGTLVLLLAMLARHLRGRASLAPGWSETLQHPWAAALFTSTALVAQQYALAPPIAEVLAWTLIAGSGAVLARLVIDARSLRVMVYCFAGLYPLFLLAEAVWVPPALFQPMLAATAAAGVLLFALLSRQSFAAEDEPAYVGWLLGLGATIWAVVLIAETAGFHRLGRWIIHAAVASALVLFVVGFLVVVARGAIWTLLNVEPEGRFRFIRTVAVPVAGRLLRIVQAVLVVGAALTLLNIWELTAPPRETWTQITGLGVAVGNLRVTVGRLLFAFVLVYLAVLLSWAVRTFVASELVPRWELERGVGDSVTAVVHYVAIALGILLALGALGLQLQNLAIVAGALSLGIGFGLQNVVNNFVSGIILLFERPVRVGDTVVIDGEWGTIRKIGLRSTIVATFDQSEMIVPNGDLVSEKVTNWTLSNPVARLTLPIGVAYGSDVHRVLEILREAGMTHPAVLPDPEPTPLFVGFGQSALEFELRVWVRELRLRLEVKSVVLAELDRRFREAGIEIPFPQRDLHLRSLDPAVLEAIRRGLPAPLEEPSGSRFESD